MSKMGGDGVGRRFGQHFLYEIMKCVVYIAGGYHNTVISASKTAICMNF